MSAVDKLIKDINKKFGDHAAFKASEAPKPEFVSTGSLALDFAIGTGGLPHNRIIEICGTEGSGKTTLGIFAMSNFLDKYPEKGVAIIDLEHKLTVEWVEMLIGEDKMSRVTIVSPNTIEEATTIYKMICQSELYSFVLIDSIGGAATDREEDKNSFGGSSLGIARFSRLASSLSANYNVCTVGINQVRADLSGYNRVVTPGGAAWKHACVLRILLKPSSMDKFYKKINGEEIQIGYGINAKVIKNQLAPPHRVAFWPFYNVYTEEFGFGIDRLYEIVSLGLATGVIEQAGAWYRHPDFEGGKIKSRNAVLDFLRENKDIQDKLSEQILSVVDEEGDHLVTRTGTSDEDISDDEDIKDMFENGDFE